MTNIVINKIKNFKLDNLIKSLNNISVDSRQFFLSFSEMNIGGKKDFDFDYISEDIQHRSFNIPLPFGINEEDIQNVCSCIIKNIEN